MTTIADRMDCRALRFVDAIQVMNTWMFEYARTSTRDALQLSDWCRPASIHFVLSRRRAGILYRILTS